MISLYGANPHSSPHNKGIDLPRNVFCAAVLLRADATVIILFLLTACSSLNTVSDTLAFLPSLVNVWSIRKYGGKHSRKFLRVCKLSLEPSKALCINAIVELDVPKLNKCKYLTSADSVLPC